MLKVLNPPVEQVDLILFFMQNSGVVQKSCSIGILTSIVDFFLHEAVDFLF